MKQPFRRIKFGVKEWITAEIISRAILAERAWITGCQHSLKERAFAVRCRDWQEIFPLCASGPCFVFAQLFTQSKTSAKAGATVRDQIEAELASSWGISDRKEVWWHQESKTACRKPVKLHCPIWRRHFSMGLKIFYKGFIHRGH